MRLQKMPFVVSLILFMSIRTGAQTKNTFLLSNPEAEGVSSKGILHFLEVAEKSKNELHSLIFLRHGKLIAEGWWDPYASELKHSMYSASKSFTATAIGFAVSEKRLSLDDKVISFFPHDLPDSISPNLSALTVRNLLTMSVGQKPEATYAVVPRDSNWVKGFLAWPIVYPPGTHFLYNTLASFMLSAIVQKVTGEKIIDYLRPRLFEPLGIGGEDWESSPRGINTGGWGLRIKTEDMAKFGELFLQKGMWRGRQILPAGWVEEASRERIIQNPDKPQSQRDSSDWEQGYCYQMWRCRHGAYRADGAYGQFIIIMPDQDAVVAITAETPDMQDELNLVWKYLLPIIHPGKLPPDKRDEELLQKKLAALSLPKPPETGFPGIEKTISGKRFTIEPNQRNIGNMSFLFTNHQCLLTIKIDTAVYNISFGSDKWKKGETAKPVPGLFTSKSFDLLPFTFSKVAGIYRWTDANTLELTLRYIESPHTETTICHFDQDKISVTIQNSNDFGHRKTVLAGTHS